MSNVVSSAKHAAEDYPGDLEDQAKGRRGWVVRRNPVTGERQLDELIWGLLPHGTNPATAPLPINARAETVADHPMFAGAFRQHRAIVPAKV